MIVLQDHMMGWYTCAPQQLNHIRLSGWGRSGFVSRGAASD